ncbi:RecQ family ATP-dependent DNA helicase [Isosphaeraceae bacterium EP7]
MTELELDQTLSERFALERFRAGQREVIESVLAGRDVLCVMPTGGGKSLCYQLPAILLPGVTLVVSPLIALMKDQVDALLRRGLRATLINSTLELEEQRTRLLDIERGQYDLVYVAPERFRSGRFVEAMARIKPALLAVDEAHCISEWGHDFRPDYAKIGQARKAMGMPPAIALTATATDLVRRDIADQLNLHDPAIFVTGFDRPNLAYSVIEAAKDANKLDALAEVLDQNPGPAIIYASSRKRCEMIGDYLRRSRRREVVVYHAGLGREERSEAQDLFMSGRAEVVVATNAFGMGVDKADVRSVVHFNIPGTLEAYYQEAGRAGRDGLPSACALIYAPGDRFLQEMFIENEYPPRDAVFRTYESMRRMDADPIELTHAEIKDVVGLDLNESAIGTVLKILEGAGAVERLRPRENMAIIRFNVEDDEPSLVGRLGPQAHTQRIVLLGLEGLVNRRFNEQVYFNPDELAGALGLDRVALTRAIRNLVAELPIDYVPPFRGNATRIVDRERPTRDLTVDFTELDRRKRLEYDKLDRMIGYATGRDCRRAYILGYFGDAMADRCGHCDNCGDDGYSRPDELAGAEIDTEAGRDVLLKTLSGVARAKGRFGKTMVAQMLTGSGSEKMDRLGLRSLSTFGLLSAFRQTEVTQLLDALSSAGLVHAQEVDRFRPIIDLTARGKEWLRDQQMPLTLPIPAELALKIRQGGLERRSARQPETPARVSESVVDGDPSSIGDDDPLRARLRTMRGDWARESGYSAYVVFTNQTLDELVRNRPTTPAAIATIKGLGPARLERYGQALLEAIKEYCGPGAEPVSPAPRSIESTPTPRASKPEPVSAPAAPRPATAVVSPTVTGRPVVETTPPAPSPTSYVPTEEWTWRLLDRGFTLDEAAAIRGLEHSAVVRHATWVARQGKPVPLAAFLDDEAQARFRAWHLEKGETPPDDGLGLPGGLWTLYLTCCAGKPAE